jgi:DNA-binding NtrC family response regulator
MIIELGSSPDQSRQINHLLAGRSFGEGQVLERVRWNRAEAARILKVSYKTLLNKIAECGLTPPSR